MRQPLTIERGRVALLLVDLQEEQRQHPLYKVHDIDAVLANARRLLLAARSAKIPVFHSAYRRDFEACPPRPFEPLGEGGRAAFSDKADPMTAICAEVEPLPDEPVLYKNDASALGEGDLAARIASAGAEWLVVAGVWTEACVAATVRDAMGKGFRVLLVKDACGSGTAAMHETAILNLANRLYGGAVADTARVERLLAGATADVWRPERPVPILFGYADAGQRFSVL